MFSGRHPQDLRRKLHVADVIGEMRLFRCNPLPALSGSSMTPVPYSVASIRSTVSGAKFGKDPFSQNFSNEPFNVQIMA